MPFDLNYKQDPDKASFTRDEVKPIRNRLWIVNNYASILTTAKGTRNSHSLYEQMFMLKIIIPRFPWVANY
jgi:hypothetical protein